MNSKQKTVAALRSAKRLLMYERKYQFDCVTAPPHENTPEAYASMGIDAYKAIRRFDRVIAKIDKALR